MKYAIVFIISNGNNSTGQMEKVEWPNDLPVTQLLRGGPYDTIEECQKEYLAWGQKDFAPEYRPVVKDYYEDDQGQVRLSIDVNNWRLFARQEDVPLSP